MRNALQAQELSVEYPKVYFSDLAPRLCDAKSGLKSSSHKALIPPECLFEAALQSAELFQREALIITQRNVNRGFSLLKRFIGMRNFGTIIDLETAYWPDRLMIFSRQV